MDQELRRAARDQDPLELAAALLRTGKPRRAWRVLADAVRAGVDGARERLDAAFPVSPDRSCWDHEGRDPDRTIDLRAWTCALEGDPRVEPGLREWIVRGSEATLAIRAALARPAGLPRLLQALEDAGGEDRWPFGRTDLARAAAEVRLHPDEVVELVAQLPAPRAGIDLLWLSAIWLLGEDGDERAVEPLRRIGEDRWLERVEAARALGKLDHAASEPLLPERSDLPARPAWAPEGAPGAVRDGLTGCYQRRALLAMPEEARGEWVLVLNLDRTKRLNDRHGFPAVDELLRRVAAAVVERCGDRVLRWGGDELLVRWERQDGPELALELRGAAARVESPPEPSWTTPAPARTTCSIGVAHAPKLSEAIRRAGEALLRAKQRGGDRVEVSD